MGLTFAVCLGMSKCLALTFTSIVSFSGTNGPVLGAVPESKLVLASDGCLYGTTLLGGTNNLGTIYKINPSTLACTTIAQFTDATGNCVQPGLFQGSDGALYGAGTYGGEHGCGTVYRATTNGELYALASLDPGTGVYPNGVIQGQDGNIYGTAYWGGTYGYGTVFKLTADGNVTALHSFGSKTNADGVFLDGNGPQSPLVEASDGAFYGTTTAGGTNGNLGTVFRITTNGVFSTLVSFNGTNGGGPFGPLIEGPDGYLYGTTSWGGVGFNGTPGGGNGTIFKLAKTGTLTILYSFTGYPDDGADPGMLGLLYATDGALYGTTCAGTTNGDGGVFRLKPPGQPEFIYSFSRPEAGTNTNSDGFEAWSGLTQTSDGTLFGATMSGGACGLGTVFCISDPAFRRPLIHSISHTNARTVLEWIPLTGRYYQLQSKSDIGDTTWVDVGNPVLGTGSIASAMDGAAPGRARIYRLLLLP